MPVPEKKSPIEHLRAFVTAVVDPTKKADATAPTPTDEESQTKPFRGRDITLDKGEDRTMKFLLAGAGGIVALIVLILALSQKHQSHNPKANAPGLGRAQQAQGSTTPSNGNIVPGTTMQPAPADTLKHGKITAQDLESNQSSTAHSGEEKKPPAATSAQTLGQIAPFNAGQSTQDSWAPKPYSGQIEPSSSAAEKVEATALAKPSLVFVSNSSASTSPASSEPLTPGLGLGEGSRLSARISSIVTTAVDLPITAVIEYNYEQNGEIIVPAGTLAVGHVQQADRSGYISIRFDHLEMPDKSVIPIDAVATNRNLGPLKGKVTGTHAGRSFLVRSMTGLGSAAAMLVGQNNSGGAISEDDLLRADIAENMGRAGDQQAMQLMMAEHPIVTLPAGIDVFLVFEKTDTKVVSTTVATSPSHLSQQNLNELREMLEIQREMNQSPAANSVPNQ
jgi:hypothetical protein